jgi:putative spermidine/putrescine transport system permease protein
LGASNLRGFWDVVVPEVAPSVLAAACLVSALAMGTYGTALALVGTQLNILPLMLYIQVSDGGVDFPAAAALSILLMVICAAVMATGDGLNRKRERHEFGANH